MGFYGNITNTSRTSFQFDKTYPSRYSMDRSVASDGVFIGRYVLIEYDRGINKLDYVTAYKRPVSKSRNGFGATLKSEGVVTEFIIGATTGDRMITSGTIIRIPGQQKDGKNYFNYTYKTIKLTKDTYEKNKYYIYEGDDISGEFKLSTKDYNSAETYYYLSYGDKDEYYLVSGDVGSEPTYTRIQSDENGTQASQYVFNFSQDYRVYGASRGYDATVWQKVYTENVQKYVMVAELNSVVPTFDISADAPSVIPVIPHFDTDSTNVYYKIHWQPSWGLRTKSADSGLMVRPLQDDGNVDIGADVNASEDAKEFPSDVKTSWLKEYYDKNTGLSRQLYLNYNEKEHTGAWEEIDDDTDTATVPAAIYFNKNGFDASKVSYSDDKAYAGWKDKKVTDEIVLTPTGKSGHVYNPHDGTYDKKPKVDTQEMEIMLPSLGDAVAKMWDMIYGGRDTSKAIQQTGRRNTDVAWEDGYVVLNRQGLRMTKDDKVIYGEDTTGNNKYNTAAVNTLAGCINSVHDLMGMIISPKADLSEMEDAEGLEDDRIYFDKQNGGYYRRHLTYTYDDIPFTSDNYNMVSVSIDKGSYAPGLYYTSTATGSAVKPENCKISNDAYSETAIYYMKRLKSEIKDEEVIIDSSLLDYEKDNYWFGENPVGGTIAGGFPKQNYVKDAIYHKGKTYYTIKTPKKVTLLDDYKAKTYYYKFDTFSYGDETVGKKQVLSDGYALDLQDKYQNGRTYYKIEKEYSLKKAGYDGIYLPNVFYYKAYADSETREPWKGEKEREFVYVLDPTNRGTGVESSKIEVTHFAVDPSSPGDGTGTTSNSFIKVTEYRKVTVTEDIYSPGKFYYYDGNVPTKINYNTYAEYVKSGLVNSTYQQITVYKRANEQTVIINESYPLTLRPYDEKEKWYKKLEDDKTGQIVYGLLSAENADRTCLEDYYTFDDPTKRDTVSGIKKADTFYVPGVYYYKITDPSNPYKDSYMLDKQEHIDRDEDLTEFYFTFENGDIKEIGGSDKFFDPDKYYDADGNLITSKPADGTTVYKKRDIFVTNDTLGKYDEGTPWSKDILSVPASITLGIRDKAYEIVPLEEFADSLNTIHGLILAINKKLEMDDTLTRDTETVQGCINSIKDVLVKIEALKPSEMVVVDAYGRIHSAPASTAQKSTASVLKETNKDNGIKGDTFAKAANIEAMKNQWLTLHVNDNPVEPKLVLRHNFQPVEDTTNKVDLNDTGKDTISLYSPIVDKMGHVVGKNTETVTLPYGFKTITTNGRGNSTAVNTETDLATNDIVAKNTQGTLGINSNNKWIRIDNDAGNGNVFIAHDVHTFDQGEANTLYGLTASKSIQELDKDNQFKIPYLRFDEAGHITSAGEHTITIPEVFTKVKVTTSTGTGDSKNGAEGTCEADSLQDELVLAEGNKWINLTADKDKDSITISHYVESFVEKATTSSFSNTAKSFDVQSLTWDAAGHITGSTKNTFTLADAFSNVKIGSSSSNGVSVDAAAGGTLSANVLQDTFDISVGNRWLSITVDNNVKSIKVYHTAPNAKSSSTSGTSTTAQAPAFGKTFNIPYIKYDETGHIFESGSTTVTIPSISFTTSSTGNVATGLTYKDGAFTLSKANVGSLAIIGYSKGNSSDPLTASDSINTAFGKLETALGNEVSNRTNAISGLTLNKVSAGTGQIISSISQADGKVSADIRALTAEDITPLLGDYSTTIQIDETYLSKNGAQNTYLAKADAGNYIMRDDTFIYKDSNLTIEQLVIKVAELENRIAALEPQA